MLLLLLSNVKMRVLQHSVKAIVRITHKNSTKNCDTLYSAL